MRSAKYLGRGLLSRPHFLASVGFLGLVFVMGGASRPDVLGQPLLRLFAWIFLAGVILTSPMPRPQYRAILLFFGAACLLAFSHVIPLPPSLWQAMPGRELMADISAFASPTLPWRPLSISPGASWNALFSLVVPAAMLGLLVRLDREQLKAFSFVTMGLIVLGAFVGLLQMSGTFGDNPFVNGERGVPLGPFANRNHFALLLAIGCMLAVPSILRHRFTPARFAIILATEAFLILLILATGSRMGLILAAIGLVLGTLIGFRSLPAKQRPARRFTLMGLVCLAAMAVGSVIAASIAQDRALSISRIGAEETGDTISRFDIWQRTAGMAEFYLPFGTGMGTFDPAYRIHERVADLAPNYINQAHNDYLGLILDAGLPGAILLVTFLVWYCMAAAKIWFGKSARNATIEQVGSGVIALILLASFVDYPARTPIVMALVATAAIFMRAPSSIAGEKGPRPAGTREP